MMRRTRLLATAAVSTALACGGLTLAPSAPASAATATGTATYTCGNPALAAVPGIGSTLAAGFTVPATFTLSNLPDVLTANVPIPAGTPLTGTFQFPTTGGLAAVLTGVSVTAGSILDPTPLSAVSTSFSNGVETIDGQLGSFTPTTDGLPIPTSFDAGILTDNPVINALGPVVTCTYNPGSLALPSGSSGGSGGSFGGVAVAKQKSAIKAHQVGKSQKVLVRVKNQTGKATGKVIAKLHNKRVGKGTLKAGKVRMKLRKLHHGLNKVKIYYRGDAISLATHTVVRVKLHH